MKLKTIVCFVVISFYTLNAQEKPKDLTSDLIKRGTFYTGLSSSLAFGFILPEQNILFPSQIKPKVGYFVLDRFSVDLSYQGSGISSVNDTRRNLYHIGELGFNYYFYARKNFLLYAQTGLAFEHYSQNNFYTRQANSSLNLKFGAGMSWRFKKAPNLGIHVEATYYNGSRMRTQTFPNISVGLTYYFGHKKTSVKR